MCKLMTTKSLLQILTLSLVVVSCGQPNPNPIDINNVDSVAIFYTHSDGTITPPPRKLSVTNTKQFVDDWNKLYPADHCKYLTTFTIFVYQKDKAKRQFSCTGQNIKEKTDQCYYLNDPEYFDKLWEVSK